MKGKSGRVSDGLAVVADTVARVRSPAISRNVVASRSYLTKSEVLASEHVLATAPVTPKGTEQQSLIWILSSTRPNVMIFAFGAGA